MFFVSVYKTFHNVTKDFKIGMYSGQGAADSVYYIYNEADFTNGRWVTANPIDPDKDI